MTKPLVQLATLGGGGKNIIVIALGQLQQEDYIHANGEYWVDRMICSSKYKINPVHQYNLDTSIPFVNIYLTQEDTELVKVIHTLLRLKRIANVGQANFLGHMADNAPAQLKDIDDVHIVWNDAGYNVSNNELGCDLINHTNCIYSVDWKDIFYYRNPEKIKELCEVLGFEYNQSQVEILEQWWNDNMQLLADYGLNYE